MIVFVIIFAVIIGFNVLTRKYVNPYLLTLVIGKKGSGKTTYLVKQAVTALRKGKKVYSTMYIPGCIHIQFDDLGVYHFEPNSVVLIDELGTLADNRSYKTFKNTTRDWFIYMRQYKIECYAVSQTVNVDKKIVQLVDRLYIQRNFLRIWSVTQSVSKKLAVGHAGEDGAGTIIEDYRLVPLIAGGWHFTFIPRWVSYYESFNPPKLQIKNYEAIELTMEQKNDMKTTKWIRRTLKYKAKRQFFKAYRIIRSAGYLLKNIKR